MKSLFRACLTAAVLVTVLLGSVTPALAQASTGGLRGVVKDESGGVLVGVTVEAESPARIGGPVAEVTDAEGIYRFGMPAFSISGIRSVAQPCAKWVMTPNGDSPISGFSRGTIANAV